MKPAGTRTCPLCRHRFRRGAATCRGCPLSGGCATVCCPRCRYGFVEDSWTLALIRRLLSRWRPFRARETLP